MDVHRCRPEEFAALRDFWGLYRAAEGPRGISDDEAEELRRKTFGNPLSQGEGTSWLAWEEDRPVAHLGVTPCPAYYYGQKLDSGWWSNFYAFPGARVSSPGSAAAALALRVVVLPQGHALVGTPGIESRVVKLYQRLRYDYWGAVPFLYFVVDGTKVLRNLFIFKRNELLAKVIAAASRLYLPGKLLTLRHWRRSQASAFCVETWTRFPSAADSLWGKVFRRYALIFERSTGYLNWRYHSPCYERLGVFREDRLVGWAVCKVSQMKGNPYFGNLKVGTLVDLLVDPDEASDVEAVFCAARGKLLARRADLLVMNLSDRRLRRAARRLGFAAGPSNYHFFTRNLPRLELGQCHVTRGDSDGDSRL